MEINKEYLNERLQSLEAKLAQFQQQFGQFQQMLNQTGANINATQGAIADSKEMMTYLQQKDPVPIPMEVVQKGPEAPEV
jgi:septation ring formation regulator EzrA